MKIHEYQAKSLFQKGGVATPKGQLAFSLEEAVQCAEGLGGYPVVVKAQIHAGGRGKGGGVKLAHSSSEVKTVAGDILGMTLVTKQTGSAGKKVEKIVPEIYQYFYLSL